MLIAIIYCILTVILDNKLVIATDQCTEYQYNYRGESCEDVYNKFAVSHNCSGYYWIANKVYCGMSFTGSSCEHIFNKYPQVYRSNPRDKSGYYHLTDKRWTYCNMAEIAANAGFSSCCTDAEKIKSTYQSFLPGESCESIYNNNEESHEWSGHYWITNRVYCGMNYTGSSCEFIFDNHPKSRDKSGYYRISNNQWTYCNMTAIANAIAQSISTCGSIEKGWRRVIKLNVNAGDDCPSGWTKANNSGYSFCQKSFDGAGCSSANFTTNGIVYQKVCGKARGYQKGHPNNQDAFNTMTIDDHYVNGLSITYGSPRQHIWTYANGDNDAPVGTINHIYHCPCYNNSGHTTPFVGNNYYCESGRGGTDDHAAYHFDDPLWDGSGCIYSKCCSIPNQPWFYRQLNESTSAAIEARLCDKRSFGAGFTMIDQLELYIQ